MNSFTIDPRNPSPFRYPGSKHALVDYVADLIGKNGLDRPWFFEPFVGGASLSLGLLERDAIERAVWCEKDPLVYSFWKAVKDTPDQLCSRLWRIRPSIRIWNSFQKYKEPRALSKYGLLEMAVAGIFFNRTNFSGVIGAKPIGGLSQSSSYKIDCRWNVETLVDKICKIAEVSNRFEVTLGDAVAHLRRNEKRVARLSKKRKALVYVDPPYYVAGPKLYRHHFGIKEHKRLARFMNQSSFPWLVSYDAHEDVRTFFLGQKVLPINFKYTVRESRRADELLITNMSILPTPALLPARHEVLRSALG